MLIRYNPPSNLTHNILFSPTYYYYYIIIIIIIIIYSYLSRDIPTDLSVFLQGALTKYIIECNLCDFVHLVAHSRLILFFFACSLSVLHLAGFLLFLLFLLLFFFFFPFITSYSFFVRAGDIPSSARRQICLCILGRNIKDYNNNIPALPYPKSKSSCRSMHFIQVPFWLPWQRSHFSRNLGNFCLLRVFTLYRRLMHSMRHFGCHSNGRIFGEIWVIVGLFHGYFYILSNFTG